MIKKQLDFYFVYPVLVILAYLFFISMLLYKDNFDFSKLIVIGDMFVVKPPPNVSFLKNSAGYDGEFYYRLALDPFTNKVEDHGLIIDFPPYRHQRIIYPLLVWTFSLGTAKFVPFMMFFVNFLGILILAILGSWYVKLLKIHPFWGIFFALYPGFLYTLSGDLTEIIQASFLLASIILLKKQKDFLAMVFLGAACLTRETSLIIPVVILFISKKKQYLLIPILTYIFFSICTVFKLGAISFSF